MVDIRFGNLRVDRIKGASGVFAGSNELNGRSHSSKRNQAFGTVNGKMNRFMELYAVIRDRDDLDMHTSEKREMR